MRRTRIIIKEHRTKSVDFQEKPNIQKSQPAKQVQYSYNINALEGVIGNLIQWKAGKVVGTGNFGQVIKALNINTGQIFAVKRIFFNQNLQSKPIQSFQQEIQLLQQFKHQNIISYIGSEITQNSLCIYIDYIPTGSIADILGSIGPLQENLIRIYTKQILNALIYLHSSHIIHGDLKGSNVLLSDDGLIKLADFGQSKQLESLDQSGLVKTMRGSLRWMAPEVIRGQGYGRKIDIWSLGCLIIEMATGKPPWRDFESPIQAIMEIGMSDQIPEIPSFMSQAGQAFLENCLIRDPKVRKRAEELLELEFVSQLSVNLNIMENKQEEFLSNLKRQKSKSNQDIDMIVDHIEKLYLKKNLCIEKGILKPIQQRKPSIREQVTVTPEPIKEVQQIQPQKVKKQYQFYNISAPKPSEKIINLLFASRINPIKQVIQQPRYLEPINKCYKIKPIQAKVTQKRKIRSLSNLRQSQKSVTPQTEINLQQTQRNATHVVQKFHKSNKNQHIQHLKRAYLSEL